MTEETIGISSFYTAEDLKLALSKWTLATSYVYGPNGEQITGFAVRQVTLTDGSKVQEVHFLREPNY